MIETNMATVGDIMSGPMHGSMPTFMPLARPTHPRSAPLDPTAGPAARITYAEAKEHFATAETTEPGFYVKNRCHHRHHRAAAAAPPRRRAAAPRCLLGARTSLVRSSSG